PQGPYQNQPYPPQVPYPYGYPGYGYPPPPVYPYPVYQPMPQMPIEVKSAKDKDLTRSLIIYEIFAVELAAFVPGITTAIAIAIQTLYHQSTTAIIQPIITGHTAMDIGLQVFLNITGIYAVVLIAYVLRRSGESLKTIGLTSKLKPSDFGVMALLTVGAFACSYMVSFASIVLHLSSTHNPQVSSGIPKVYIIVGLIGSFRTALLEEVAVCGFILHRLEQLKVSPFVALLISVALRCSYHVYGGWPLIALTIPFGLMQGYVYQRNRSIKNQVIAHFIYDSVIFTLYIFVK
ncbi:MAG: CPBP family intramembrane metalloprotease, partial [Acidimicrobiales bacterium]|nr:CPBP family intramembrane metalloprotease [Acidimicrobiales bacterium]